MRIVDLTLWVLSAQQLQYVDCIKREQFLAYCPLTLNLALRLSCAAFITRVAIAATGATSNHLPWR